MMFIKVDLPDPDAPIMATDEPRSIERSTPRSARTVVSPMEYARSMPLISTSVTSKRPCFARRGGQALNLGDQRIARLEVALQELRRRAVC